MAGRGFISVAPNYPGYSGSDPAPPDLPNLVAITVSVMDLVSSLASLKQAVQKPRSNIAVRLSKQLSSQETSDFRFWPIRERLQH